VTFRPFRGHEDLPGMTDLINARVAEEGEGEHATVASLMENYDHLQNCDVATDMIVAEDESGRVVGYARTFWADVSEGYRGYYVGFEASPEFDGLGRDIVEWGVNRAEAVAGTHDHVDRRIVLWANETGTRAELVGALGYEAFAWSAYMVRPHLRDIPDAPLPDGLELRPVAEEHLRAIWEADIEAFRDHRGYVEQTEIDFERFLDEAKTGTDLWQIAWDGDTVGGQVRTHVNDGEAQQLGRRRAWTENISTRREWRGKGVASALIASSLRQLAGLGFDEAGLGVDLDNPTRALGVYERIGFKVVLRQIEYFKQL